MSINDIDQGHEHESDVIENAIENNHEQYSAILTQMERDPNITIKELVAVLGLGERQVSRRIRELKTYLLSPGLDPTKMAAGK